MTDGHRTDGSESGRDAQTVTRRRLLGGAATAGVAASLPAFVGGAAAQSETTGASQTGTAESDDTAEPVTTRAALPTDAPTFDQSNYVGLFLQVTGFDRQADATGVGDCNFVGAEDDVTAFDATIFETTGDRPSEEVTLYTTTQQGTVIDSGSVLVINSQSECSSDFVTLGVEEVEASDVGTPADPGTETGGAIPGFDAVAGVLGVTAASAAAAVRLRGDEE